MIALSTQKRRLLTIVGFIQFTFFLIVGHVLFVTGGNFHPGSPDLWKAASWGVPVSALMHFSVKKNEVYWENQSKPFFRRIRMISTFVCFSILFMIVLPFGTFNPLKIGFLCCVMAGAVVTELLRKYH